MKITAVNIPSEVTDTFGLKSVKMDRISNMVLIAGRNGSGKTRLLTLLRQTYANCPTKEQVIQIKSQLSGAEKSIQGFDFQLSNIQESLKTATKEQQEILNGNIAHFNNLKNNSENIINTSLNSLRSSTYISFEPDKLHNTLVNLVPISLALQDSFTLRENELEDYSKRIFLIGTDRIADGVIPAIQKITNQYINVKNSDVDLDISEEERSELIENYERLKKYIKIFLNTDLKRNKEGQALLFGKRIGQAELSNGQTILLQFCLAIYAQESKLEDLIILMDEPENHLHPAALIEVIDKIASHVTNGQIWIATHSVNVLAHFDQSNIWYIDDGKISYAGNIPKTVLSGLLGNDEEIEKLKNFLSLPAEMGINKFAFESLFYPKVLITGKEDPQVNQINEIITERTSSGKKIKILDFGMGKGRLLSTIVENEELNNTKLSDWLDFVGFDNDSINKDLCTKIIQSAYGTADKKYYNESTKVLIDHDKKTFDLIVMCNVFHEIDPTQWITIFNSPNSLFKLLKDEGHLLIVEDQLLAVGEKAHSKGFLVYDALEFKTLFKITHSDGYKANDCRGDGRLMAHHIPQQCVGRIDIKSKKKSLTCLIENSKEKIREIRSQEPSFKNGRLHGFWAQQLANASLAFEEL